MNLFVHDRNINIKNIKKLQSFLILVPPSLWEHFYTKGSALIQFTFPWATHFHKELKGLVYYSHQRNIQTYFPSLQPIMNLKLRISVCYFGLSVCNHIFSHLVNNRLGARKGWISQYLRMDVSSTSDNFIFYWHSQ